jgi:predicted transposase/invertase (TIGR01784 family)
MKFADPKNDLAFKKIFGNENRKDILISFLNAALDFRAGQTIVDVTLDNPYQLPDIKELKETILDIQATNKNGDKFIVEMQKKDLSNFAKRSLYYTSKAYVAQIDKAVDVINLKKVYYIAILNFNMFDNKNYISRHLIINQETMTQDLKDFEFTFIELKKFKLELTELESIIEKWIFFIKNASNFDMIPHEYEDIKEFREAFEIANKFSWNKKELAYYDSVNLRQADDKNALDTAENKGIKKGLELGLKQGIEQGIEQGILDVAKNSLSKGLSVEIISQITGLSLEQIKSLTQEHSSKIC